MYLVQQFTSKEKRVATSYSFFYGTPGTIRTYDTWFRRPVLYPLSYGCEFTLTIVP